MARTNSAKEDAPTFREYRDLQRSADNRVSQANRDNYDFRLECRFVLRMIGELGFRAGEVAHFSESWVDFEQLEIRIPSYDECTKGNDGGPCHYCQDMAQQTADHSDISYERALRDRWEPKNKSSIRTIWFGWNDELIDLIDEYTIQNDSYPASRASINRRIDRIAEESDLVDKDSVYPHALRGYAAKYHAKAGMRVFQLKELMGWSNVDGAMDYIQLASNDVRTEMKRIHQDPLRR